ncbi:MAG: hypothetical protein GY751_17380, partial [Bacteroidetes bacterium]|nr:hypothetical protein [Bacteroidota bacterium]
NTPYQYSIDGGSTYTTTGSASYTFTGLTGGTYAINAIDADGCETLWPAPITINDLSGSLSVSEVTSINNNICFNDNDGVITISISGGDLPYEVSIDGGTTFETSVSNEYVFGGLAPDSYQVFVSDANGCIAEWPVAVEITSAPSSLLLDSVAAELNPCLGPASAEITIYSQGGLPPYNYSIDGGATFTSSPFNTYQFADLMGGTYTVGVTDALGCSLFLDEAIVFDNVPKMIEIDSVIAIGATPCDTSEMGEISIYTGGGLSPYSYSIDGGVTFSTSTLNQFTFDDLTAGTYSIVVQDANGCETVYGTIIEIEPVAGAFSVESVVLENNNTCFNDNDGIITISLSGGVGPYQYSIDGGATSTESVLSTFSLTDVAPGLYTVTVSDVNDCQTTWSELITITGPASAFELNDVIFEANVCEGEGN